MYIFISFHIVNQYHTKSDVFSSKNHHDYIYIFFYNSSMNKKLIKRLGGGGGLDTIFPVFALFQQK